MGSQFSSFFPINVINVAVSADRAMLDNQIGIKFEFLRLPPREAHGKTLKVLSRIRSGEGLGLQRENIIFLSALCATSACHFPREPLGNYCQCGWGWAMVEAGQKAPVSLHVGVRLEQCWKTQPLLIKADGRHTQGIWHYSWKA